MIQSLVPLKYLDIFQGLSMCIAMYLQQNSLIIAAIKLKYISDCQVAYKEDERERERMSDRFSEIKSVTVFRSAYKKR